MHRQAKPGYILITTLLLLTGMSMLVVSLLRVTWTGQEFTQYVYERTQARALAYSGLELAKMQMAYIKPQDEEEQAGGQQQKKQQQGQQQGQQQEQGEQQSEEQKYLMQTLRYINRWQAWELDQEQDGIEGTIYLYITPETGKVPLNALFDRENKRLSKAAQSLVPKFKDALSAQGMQGDLNAALEEVAQNPPYFDDPTQLIPLHSAFAFFKDRRFLKLNPAKEEPETWRVPVLFDLVTTFTDADQVQLNPLFFSRSICTLLGLSPLPQQQEARKEMLDTFKEKMGSQLNWQQDWDTLLAPYYGISYSELSQELRDIFTNEYSIERFSVVSYGDIHGTRVAVYAILERVAGEQHDTFRVHRMYWI